MPPEKKIARRQIVVDTSFQLQFLRIWLLVGTATVLLSGGVYFVVRRMSGVQPIHPLVLKVLLGMSVFILLFCALMGTFSIILAHRVAGAAYRIEKSLDRMIEGEVGEPVVLRKGDYLTRIAERLNLLQEKARVRGETMHEIARLLSELKGRVSTADHGAIDRLIERTRTVSPV
ncbi:MAG: hypothetical protein HYY17_00645 [Planctomycetes bacterium]|nr:hypothetical protein [Planctomycetota bacterium]